MDQQIAAHLDDPAQLEQLFRGAPDAFRRCFPAVCETYPESVVLQVWRARLAHDQDEAPRATHPPLRRPFEISLVVLLALAAGTFAKLPDFFGGIDESFFYERNFSFFVLPALVCYFLVKRTPGRRIVLAVAALTVGSWVYINLLPQARPSDTIELACMHLPFFLWSVLGVAYAGGRYRETSWRQGFLKYNGEMLAYTAIILIGGIILTGMTLALFSAIGVDLEDWYTRYVVVYGIVAAPVVATSLAFHRAGSSQQIAPVIAKIFGPLVLLTLVAYLLTMLWLEKNPYTDREVLIVFNGMLLGVLALTIFSVSERPSTDQRTASDYVNVTMIVVALLLDLIALSAIAFRLASYGLTPNRMAVLGANLLVFAHLGGVLYPYLRFLQNRGSISAVEAWLAGQLPLYAVWTAFITFVYPFLFSFR